MDVVSLNNIIYVVGIVIGFHRLETLIWTVFTKLFKEDQAHNQLRPLNGTLNINLKSGVYETFLSPDQLIPLNELI